MWNLLRSHYNEMNLKSKMRGMFLALAVMYLLVSFLALLTMTFQSAEQYLSAHSRTVTESVGVLPTGAFQRY